MSTTSTLSGSISLGPGRNSSGNEGSRILNGFTQTETVIPSSESVSKRWANQVASPSSDPGVMESTLSSSTGAFAQPSSSHANETSTTSVVGGPDTTDLSSGENM